MRGPGRGSLQLNTQFAADYGRSRNLGVWEASRCGSGPLTSRGLSLVEARERVLRTSAGRIRCPARSEGQVVVWIPRMCSTSPGMAARSR